MEVRCNGIFHRVAKVVSSCDSWSRGTIQHPFIMSHIMYTVEPSSIGMMYSTFSFKMSDLTHGNGLLLLTCFLMMPSDMVHDMLVWHCKLAWHNVIHQEMFQYLQNTGICLTHLIYCKNMCIGIFQFSQSLGRHFPFWWFLCEIFH